MCGSPPKPSRLGLRVYLALGARTGVVAARPEPFDALELGRGALWPDAEPA